RSIQDIRPMLRGFLRASVPWPAVRRTRVRNRAIPGLSTPPSQYWPCDREAGAPGNRALRWPSTPAADRIVSAGGAAPPPPGGPHSENSRFLSRNSHKPKAAPLLFAEKAGL